MLKFVKERKKRIQNNKKCLRKLNSKKICIKRKVDEKLNYPEKKLHKNMQNNKI